MHSALANASAKASSAAGPAWPTAEPTSTKMPPPRVPLTPRATVCPSPNVRRRLGCPTRSVWGPTEEFIGYLSIGASDGGLPGHDPSAASTRGVRGSVAGRVAREDAGLTTAAGAAETAGARVVSTSTCHTLQSET